MKFSIFILSLCIYSYICRAAFSKTKCPTLDCASVIQQDVCYLHDGMSPVEMIKTFYCPDDQWCYLNDGEFAWVNNNLQDPNLEHKNRDFSNVFSKYTQRTCTAISSFM
jgi:hypothetical protein